MTTTLAARAEVQRLARLLGVEPERIGFLERVAPADLRALRLRVSDVLFDADRSTLQKVAAVGRFLPAPLVATFAEKFFGPVLGARVAGLLGRGRAVDLAKRLPAPFLAELSVALDPRRMPEVLAGIPAGKIVEVARELARRDDYATMASFVPHLPDETLLATTDVVDDAGLLLIGFHMDTAEGLDHLIDLLPEKRLRGIVRAAGEVGLWPEALALMNGVSEAQRSRLADLAVEEGVLDGLVGAARDQGLWDAVLPLVRPMSEANRRRLADLPILHDEEVLAGVVRAASEDDELWPDLLPLVSLLPDPARRQVEEHARRLGVADRLDEPTS
jgi:hypothetical protein